MTDIYFTLKRRLKVSRTEMNNPTKVVYVVSTPGTMGRYQGVARCATFKAALETVHRMAQYP